MANTHAATVRWVQPGFFGNAQQWRVVAGLDVCVAAGELNAATDGILGHRGEICQEAFDIKIATQSGFLKVLF